MDKIWLKKSLLSFSMATMLGFSGQSQAVVTAILDTGIDSGTLEDVKVAGFDFVDNDANTDDRSPVAHGTFQGLIFNQNAPAELIMPLRTYSGAPGTSSNMSLAIGQAAMDFAIANSAVKVIVINRLQPIDLGRLQRATKNDKVIVINSGNQAAAQAQGSATLIPALRGSGLIVTGHDTDGTISETSNRIGTAFASHGIAALFSATNLGTSVRGSSFAMARVAAAAAIVKSRSPFLTPKQVVDILKRSATDAGAPGVDAVFGNGRLNAAAALNAIGTTNVAGKGGGSSSSGAAAGGALLAGAGLFALFDRGKKLKKTLILDEFGRGFSVDMTKAITRRDQTPGLDLVMAALDTRTDTFVVSQSEDSASYSTIRHSGGMFQPVLELQTIDSADKQENLENISLAFHSVDRSGKRLSFGINEDQKSHFGAMSLLPSSSKASFLNGTLLSAPMMGFTNKGLSSSMAFKPMENVQIKFGLSSTDDQQRWGLSSESAFFETSYETQRWGLSLQLGELVEQGSLFGGSSDGAFSVDSASTVTMGLSGRYQIGQRTSMIGSYHIGLTDVKDRKQSLLSNFSSVKTDSYGAGIVSSNVFRRGDRLGAAYFQPIRVNSGAVDATIPYAQDDTGKVYFDNSRYSLVPEGTESIVEFYYGTDMGKSFELGSHILYRDEAGHNVEADRERILMFTLNRSF
ncbi:MAG: hypothetical protein ACI8P9_001438 [Parasphingorhabdus sp.]|jgi:hypothetical protein